MAIVYPLIQIDGNDYPALTTLAAAKLYLAADPNAVAWATADDPLKGKALVMASRVLSRQKWNGQLTEADQLLAWPRTGLDGIDPLVIPAVIEAATAELAAAMLAGYDAAGQASTASGIKRQKAGSVEQEFFASAALAGGRFPLPVQELLAGLLAGDVAALGLGGSFSSGTCGESAFARDYGLVGTNTDSRYFRDNE